MEMRKGLSLVKRAARDFELARKYKDAREYITASILYRKATEKVLRALFIASRRKKPPVSASIEYLAMQTGLPSGIYDDLVSMPDERDEMAEEENLLEYDDEEQTHMAEDKEYRSAMTKHELVRRLIDYARARTNVL